MQHKKNIFTEDTCLFSVIVFLYLFHKYDYLQGICFFTKEYFKYQRGNIILMEISYFLCFENEINN